MEKVLNDIGRESACPNGILAGMLRLGLGTRNFLSWEPPAKNPRRWGVVLLSEPRDTIRGVLCPNNPSRKTHGLDLLVILSPSDPLTRGNTTIQSILSPHIGSLSNTCSQKRILFITILANPLCVGPDSIYDVCLAHVVESHMGIERVNHSLRLAIAISRSVHSHV